MLSLIQIRSRYLYRHPCLLFWSYMFLPGVVFLLSMVSLKVNDESSWLQLQPKREASFSDEDYFFAEEINNTKVERNYTVVKEMLENMTIIINEEGRCNDIIQFVEGETNITVNCTYDPRNYTNDTIYILKMEKTDNKYKIRMSERDKGGIARPVYSRWDLDQGLMANLFVTANETRNETILSDKRFKAYWEMQSFFSKMLIKFSGKKIKNDIKISLGFNAYPPQYRYTDRYGYGIISFLSFMLSLQFSLIAYNFNMRMIDEKENKLNILLERQGISKFQYFLSWLITFYSLFSFSILAYCMFIYIHLKGREILILIVMGLYSFCLFSACVFFTTIIKSTKAGTTAVKFFNFGSLLLGFVIMMYRTAYRTKVFFALIPQINIFLAMYTLFQYDNFDTITWDKLWVKAGRFSLIESSAMFIFDIILYLGLSVIIQSYKDSGLDFWDFIKSKFVNVSRNVNNTRQNYEEAEKLNVQKFETHHQELSNKNKQQKEQNTCLKIVNVSKYFDDLKAVDNYNGELFSNEIFCLLGHNGAGKTTLVNMISGIMDPNKGDILYNGKSFVTNKKYLYENIGLCQQEDIFFDYLTVQEHLEYMCEIKGSKINQKEIMDLIRKIDLYPKRDALCSTLSGGQKRKLCIALALIGGSHIILLDEPTSGMDIMARRKLWEFLKNYKKDKIILLTTHFLDEAEYLGDRIGIMSDGKYLCSGTSSFLKSKYPCGFNLNLLINEDIFNEDYKNKIFEGVKQFEPKAEIRVASKGTFCINISSNNQKIKELFDFIESIKGEYGITDYTVSSTSLEDVFLKINNKAVTTDTKYIKRTISYKNSKEIKLEEENAEKMNDKIKTDFKIEIRTSGFCQQFVASMQRGIYPLVRNKMLFGLELLSGLGFVYIFIFCFSDLIINASHRTLCLIDNLVENQLFYYQKDMPNNFLQNSYVYSLKEGIILNQLPRKPEDIIDLANMSYEQAYVNIAKSSMYVDGKNQDLLNVYLTEVDQNLNGYLYADTMLLVSSFLKNYYDIDAAILNEIEMNIFSDGGIVESLLNLFKDFVVLLIVCLITVFGFVIFLGGLMFEKIKEQRLNIKHLLYLSGNNFWSYWLGFYVVDYIKLIFYNIFLMIPIFYVSNVAYEFSIDIVVISLSSLSFIYFISFFCKKDDDGAKILFVFVFGFLIIVSGLLVVFQDEVFKYSSGFKQIYKLHIFDLTPITSMALSFTRIIMSNSFWEAADKTMYLLNDVFDVDLEWEQINGFYRPKYYLYTSFMAQAVNFVVYTLLLIFAESGLLGKIIHRFQLCLISVKSDYVFSKEIAAEEFMSSNNIVEPIIGNGEQPKKKNRIYNIEISDEELERREKKLDPLNNPYVKREKEKVTKDAKELTTKIKGIRKTFYNFCGKNVRAINDLYLGLEPNEKFGLLGFNGSGKTTTFKSIINEILIDKGTIDLFGFDNQKQFKRIRTMIGYCPQINPLFDFMKVKEIIKYYLDLKTSKETVESISEKFGISKYLETYTINLSGGNKRKLTFAIAMMNQPTLLLLDEPSTGVDPESRRVMWRNINELSNSGHRYNMMLTTHSIEEAEILCDNVSWLKAGNFVCIGNPEELKVEFSNGYTLHIKFDDREINKEKINEQVEELIRNLKELTFGVDAFEHVILENKNIVAENYLSALIKVLTNIKDKTKKMEINDIRKDMSFEINLEIIKEKQKDLFVEVLNLKNVNKQISELSITMQSLENILTSLN